MRLVRPAVTLIAAALAASVAAPVTAMPLGTVTSPSLALASGTPVRSTLFGIHPANLGAEPMPRGVTGSWRLWDSGTMWATLEPRAPTAAGHRYVWDNLDAQVRAGRAAGVSDFLITIGLTPRWASRNPGATTFYGSGASTAPPASYATLATYVIALARHVSAKNDLMSGTRWSFQVWNEGNLATFYTGTQRQLAQMTGVVDRAAKSVSPSILVVSPSTTTRLGLSTFREYLAELRYVKGYRNRSWPVDAWSFHPYPAAYGEPADAARAVGSIRSALASAGAPRRQLWDTEINYGLPGPGGAKHRSITGTQAASYVARTYLDSARLGVTRAYWYAWVGSSASSYLGITMYTSTPALRSMATVSRWLSGATLLGCTGTSVYTCRFTQGTDSFRVIWGATNYSSARISLPRPVRACRVDGSATGGRCFTASGSITVGSVPVRLG